MPGNFLLFWLEGGWHSEGTLFKYVIVTQVSGVKYSPHLGLSATSTGKIWRRAKMTKITKEPKRGTELTYRVNLHYDGVNQNKTCNVRIK
jgi:hypothetical protein